MKRKLLIVVLALGTVAGFGSAAASFACRRHAWQERVERRAERACHEGARRAIREARGTDGQGAIRKP